MQAVILLFTLLLGSVSSEFYYYIKPSPSVHCPSTLESVPCLTLSQFLNTSSAYISFNTTLIFLSGNHSLDPELVVNNVSTFSMLSNSVSSSNTVLLICGYNGAFIFESINSVHISGLTFFECTGSRLVSVNYFFLEDSNFIGNDKGTALELFKSTATLFKTSFYSNVANKLYNIDCPQYQKQGQAQAGGAIVSIQSNITVLHSVFKGNNAVAGGAIFHTNCNATVTIQNCTVTDDCASRFKKEIRASHESALKNLGSLTVNHINIIHCKFISNYISIVNCFYLLSIICNVK